MKRSTKTKTLRRIGRILTVILGLYGLVVVSILTSIIVNFYSEVKDIKDDEDTDPKTAVPAENEQGKEET